MDTASIPTATPEGERRITMIASFSLPCGCEIEGGRAVERCTEAEGLWRDLIAARDALRADERRRSGWRIGHKARRDAFVAARDAYHGHLRPEVAA